MNKFESYPKRLMWLIALLLTAFITGCGGGNVTSVAPASNAKAIIAFSLNGVTGTINEAAKTIAVTVPFGTNVTALVATFTTTGASVKVGATAQASTITPNSFAGPVTYTVTAADGSTAAYVVIVNVALNSAKAITAFSLAGVTGTINEAAVPKTIAVTVPFGTSKTALVATFTSTATNVKVGATAQTSGTTPNDFTSPVSYTVTAADGSTAVYVVTVNVALNSAKAITAFSLAGVTGTINEAAVPKTIAVTVPSGTNKTALVATFTATGASVKVGTTVQTSGTTPNDFTNPVVYTVTAADSTTANYTVTVTLSTLPANPTAPTLGEAGRFVILGSLAVTTTGVTAISNGDIGVTPGARSTMTGFTPSGSTGAFVELTNGMSYAPDDANPAPFPYPLHYSTPVVGAAWTTTAAMLTQASSDLGVAKTFLDANPNPGAPTQVCPTELGTLTLTRGVYNTASNVTIQTGTLTLDAQGDPNSVWIFKISGTLTTGAPGGNITLINGALARNVYWSTGGIATIGAGTIFKGSVFAQTQANLLSGVNLTGSLFAVTDRVTLIGDTVTKAP
jgi:hypothetical protein